MLRRSFLLALAALSVAGCYRLGPVPPAERKAVMISFDGGGERVIETLLARGAMPHLAALRARGVTPDYAQTNFPSKTAAGHAALWTGAFGNVNGINGNKVFALPTSRHTILEVEDGFSSSELLAEPFFVTAARAGKRVLGLQPTHVAPFSAFQPGGRWGGPYRGSLTLIDGYSGERGVETVFGDPKAFKPAGGAAAFPRGAVAPMEATLQVGVERWRAVAFDDPADPTAGYDALRLYPETMSAELPPLKPGLGTPWSGWLPVKTADGPGRAVFKLFELAPDLSRFRLYHSTPVEVTSNKPEAVANYYEPGGFLLGGAMDPWSRGELGTTMFKGGDGTAEDYYLETVARTFAAEHASLRVAFERRDWDLLFQYIPYPDEALHYWYGAVDTESPSYDPAIAPRVWRQIERVAGHIDRYIGEVAARAGDDTVIALVSDHGMAGIKWLFYPNTVLKEAGLLAVDAKGVVDLKKTQVMYAATDGGYLVVNRQGRKGGIVPEHRVAAVLKRAEAALAAVQAHDGTPLVTQFIRPTAENAAALGVGGPRGGDLYLDLQRGYLFHRAWDKQERFKAWPAGGAGHVFDPRRSDMHAQMTLAGPGLKRGVAIGPVRNIDAAPTIARLLNLPAPPQATGRVIEEALEP